MLLFYNDSFEIHWSKQWKGQSVLLLFSFVHNSFINEQKNMKISENAIYEKINCNLYFWGFGNTLQLNNIEFFVSKNWFLEKIIIFLERKKKMEGGNNDAFQSGRYRYTARNYITTWIFSWISLFFNFINGLLKKYIYV